MTSIQKSVDVRVPVRTAYDQWTQFESFPDFMDGVEEVTQLDAAHTRWRTRIGGVRREFDAEITEQHPDERVAWRSVDGPSHGGAVTFHRLDEHSTRVTVQLEYEPASPAERIGARFGLLHRRVAGDLRRFADFVAARGVATGAWRGEIPRPAQHGETRGVPTADRGGTAALSNPPTNSAGDGVLAEQRRRQRG